MQPVALTLYAEQQKPTTEKNSMNRKNLELVTTGTSLCSFISDYKVAQRGDSDDTKDIVAQPYQRGNGWGTERKSNLIHKPCSINPSTNTPPPTLEITQQQTSMPQHSPTLHQQQYTQPT